jgi:hypothetical protein
MKPKNNTKILTQIKNRLTKSVVNNKKLFKTKSLIPLSI